MKAKANRRVPAVVKTYGAITPKLKAAAAKAFKAGVKHGKLSVEKDKTHMSSKLLKTTYLNGYKQGRAA